METTFIPNGPPDENGVIPVTQAVTLKVTMTAEGYGRQDGLTAAQVRAELKEKEAANGS
jgi:hypothetical protein